MLCSLMAKAVSVLLPLLLFAGSLQLPTACGGTALGDSSSSSRGSYDEPECAENATTTAATAVGVAEEDVSRETESDQLASTVAADKADDASPVGDFSGRGISAAEAVQAVRACRPGHQLVGGVCVDVDECRSFADRSAQVEEDRRDVCGNYVHSHRPGYRCVNTPGSYRCERIVDCGFGYVLNGSLGVCVDIDECKVLGYQAACGTTLPIKVCINLDGTFRCEYRSCPPGKHLDHSTGLCNPCRRGYFKNARGNCQDIDECQRLTLHNCQPHMRCVNYDGGYECKHKIFCQMGRRANYNGTECIDIDECSEQPGICGRGRICANTVGAYLCEQKQCGKSQELNFQSGECVCTDGFRMNLTSHSCEDINECVEGGHNCDSNDVCRNTRGHFDCFSRDKVCEPGFGLNFDHTTCVDIDECKLGQYKCDQLEYCNNTHGSYTCQCRAGFHRVGTSKECTDIDECAAAVSAGTVARCPPRFLCVNTVGSFACRCPPGHRPDASERTCVDVDECVELPGLCGPAGRCQNRPPGAYTCTCAAGYMANETVGGTCVDIDECRLRACPTGAVCRNSPGGFDCACDRGLRFVRGSNECEDVDECRELRSAACPQDLSCFNYRGRYSCYRLACPAGFRAPDRVPQRILNTLSFNCEPVNASCQPVSGHLRDDPATPSSQKPPCAARIRKLHKAQAIAADSGDFATIQSDMRRSLRACQFRAALTRGDNVTQTVHYSSVSASVSTAFPNLQFEQKLLGLFTICSTKLRLAGDTAGVTRVQLTVTLIGRKSVELSDYTIHIVQL